MNRERLDRLCEQGILVLVLGILVFGPLATGAVRTPDFLVIQALTMLVMLLWGIRLWIKPRPQLLWPPISWSVIAFSAYAIIRYFNADIEYVARFEITRVIVYAFLFFVVVNNLHRQEHAPVFALTLTFLAMAISFYAVFQFVTSSDRVWTFISPYKHRASGTYISPNHLAGLLDMILPLALCWMLISRTRILTKVFIGYAALAIAVGLAVTLSRGGWAATGLTLVVFFSVLLSYRPYRLPSIALLVLLTLAAAYLLPRAHFLKVRVREMTSNEQFNDSARFDLWKPAILLWRENEWWGIGPNHYNFRFRAYRPQVEQRQPDRAHNDYLNTLTDWGIIGFAWVTSAWVFLAAGVVKTWRRIRGPGDLGGGNSNKLALLLGGSLGLLAILFHSFVDFNMNIPANAIVAISLMAMLTGALRFADDKYWIAARLGIRTVVTFVLLAGLVYLGWQGSRAAREYAWLHRAERMSSPDDQIAALQKAFAIEPKNFETAYAIGEAYRSKSWEGASDYIETADRAREWYVRCTTLNPYEGYGYMRYGMCLDWVDRSKESPPYFDKAVQLDPNGYFTAANVGWHHVQTGNYAAARSWLERSKRLHGDNPIADSYLPIITAKMLQAATNSGPRL
jgi:O-antigen ligase